MDISNLTKILVAEDDTLLRKSISRFIDQNGYVSLEAVNGCEALALFRKEHPSLVLTDLRMPVMDGFDLLNELDKESPETPVIIFSGIGTKPDIIHAIRLGAVDYITKPVENAGFLLDRIEKALRNAHRRAGHKSRLAGSAQKGLLARDDKEKNGLELGAEVISNLNEWDRAVDSMDELIAVMDRDHRLVKVNKAMAKVLGKKTSEVIGSTRYLSTHGLDNKKVAVSDLNLLLNHEVATGRFYEENQQAYYEVKVNPCYGSDNWTVVGCVYIARDVSNF